MARLVSFLFGALASLLPEYPGKSGDDALRGAATGV